MAGRRPPHLEPRAHLAQSPLVPAPAPARPAEESGGPGGAEPTRYGDWERNGICRDF